MSNQRFHVPGFNTGCVRPSIAARPGSDGNAVGLSTASNFSIGEDGSLFRRPGSVWWAAIPNPDENRQKVIPYQSGGSLYVIVMTFDNDAGGANSYIEVYESDGSLYSTTEINFRPTSTADGRGQWSPYISTTHATSATKEGTPYGAADIDEIQYFQYEDILILTHPNYSPIKIRKGPGSVWEFDPYFLEREPPEVWSSYRDATVFTLGVAGAGNTFPLTTSTEFYTADMLSTQFNTPVTAQWDGVNTINMGAIFRLGDMPTTDTAQGDPIPHVGEFWTVTDYTDQRSGTVSPLFNQTGAGTGNRTYGGTPDIDNQEFAGPWFFERTVTLGVDTSVGASNGQIVTSTFTGLDETCIGGILVHKPASGNARLAAVLYATSGNQRLQNIGPDFAGENWTTGTTYLYMPKRPVMWVETGTGYTIGGAATPTNLFVFGGREASRPLPDDFMDEANYHTDAGWFMALGPLAAEGAAGGAVFPGNSGGFLRIQNTAWGAGLTTNYDDKGRISQWGSALHQSGVRSCGPFNNYGIGPSRATGFPACGTAHEQRIYLSGFKDSTSAVVASGVSNPTRFNQLAHATDPASPLNLLLAFQEGDTPRWILSGDRLLVGCESNLYALSGNPISSASLGFQRVSSRGSAYSTPVRLGNETCWVAPDRNDILAATYNDGVDAVQARSLLSKATHLLKGATVKRLITANEPWTMLLALLSDGRFLVLSASPETGVEGWSVMETGSGTDTFNDIARVRAPDDSEWELWTVASRDFILGSTLNTIERFSFRRGPAGGTLMDMSVFASLVTATTCSVPLLAEREVGLIVDGVWAGTYTAALGGGIDYADLGLTSPPTVVLAGVVFEATATFHMPTVAMEAGPSAGGMVNLGRPVAFVEDSYGGTWGIDREILPVTLNTALTATTDWVATAGVGVGPRTRFPQITLRHNIPYNFKLGGLMFEGGGES